MNFYLAPPPGMSTQELFDYLYKMSEYLNIALNSPNGETTYTEAADMQYAGTKKDQKARQKEAEALKSLIIKTANTVRSEMDRLQLSLQGEYEALSEDYGSFRAETRTEIEATARGLTQVIQTTEELESFRENQSDFNRYTAQTSHYIKSGILFYDNGEPTVGIAVGENLLTETVDGNEVLKREGFHSIFTADRLGFWHGETEVAYVSDKKLYIASAEILGGLTVGNWDIRADHGLAFKWIGTI